jgi:hypothetical protein
MKKCYYFPTWEEKLTAMISIDEQCLMLLNCHDVFTKFNTYYDTPIGEIIKYYKNIVPNDRVLYKLCELTGAKMYGDYVMFDFFLFNEIVDNLNRIQAEAINYFQEYSKYLRNEENKWEEVKKFLDL